MRLFRSVVKSKTLSGATAAEDLVADLALRLRDLGVTTERTASAPVRCIRATARLRPPQGSGVPHSPG